MEKREIKFRYKIKDRKKYLYDDDPEFFYVCRNRKRIATVTRKFLEIEEEMQYSGCDDADQNNIYENDQVVVSVKGEERLGRVVFKNGAFYIVVDSNCFLLSGKCMDVTRCKR